MKISIFILFVSISMAFAESKAQQITLNLTDAKLEDVFTSISSQSPYKFFYNDIILKEAPKVSIRIKDASIKEVMDRVLRGQKLTYKVLSETVTVTVDNRLAAEETKVLQNQVSGTVHDARGRAITGASVIVKGSVVGTTTDATGRFRISASPNSILEIRFLGYKGQEVNIDSRQEITIVLTEDEMAIEAVNVVATGYQNLDRKLFTGASTKVNAKDAERAGVPDISRMLEGQAAGVSVQNVSGTFGAAPKIRVRGATSLSGDNKPLWVIDGIILEDVVNISNEALSTGDANTLIGSSVAGLNPDDIESFTILKDAAATAMYGARAMNGVIVVTTKKGRNTDGRVNVNYSGNLTSFLKPTYSQFDIMNSAEQISVLLELENKGYFNHSAISRTANGGIFYKMYNQMYEYDEASDSFTLKNTKEERLRFLERYAKANTDWFDLLFKNSLLQEHSFSISGGTSRNQTYFSSSFLNDKGMTIADKVKRYTANFRNNFKINDKLSAEVLVNGSVRDQRTPGTLGRASDAVYGQYTRDFDINPYSYALNTSRLMTPYDEHGELEFFTRNYAPFNILHELENNYLKLGMLDLKVQAGVKYRIIRQLTYSLDGAYRFAKTERQHYIQDGSNMAAAFRANADGTIANNNPFLYNNPDFPNLPPVVVLPEGGFYNTSLNNLSNYYFRQNLEYDDTFALNHRVNVFGSMEIRQTDRQYSNYQGIGYQYENGGLVNPDYRFLKNMIEGGDPYFGMSYGYDRFVAAMLRGAYAYKDRYSLNSTVRWDGSNLMGRSKVARWLPTWNISGKWNIDQEDFFPSDNPILSAISIRGTYGLTASLGNANNSAPVFYNQISHRPYENEKEALIRISGLENSELTWEKLYETNIGADLQFFDRVDITFDWYKRDIFDLIGPVRTSGIGGQFLKNINYADMKSHGVELTVAGNVLKASDGFRWRTQFNFGLNKNEITNLEANAIIWNMVRAEGGAQEGYAQRGLYSLRFAGLDSRYGYPTYVGTGGERNSFVQMQSGALRNLVYHGPVDPTFTGGFYNNFSYKNLSLSALFTFSQGNFVRLQPTYSSFYSDQIAMSKDIINRWMMPGDEQITTIPSLLDQFARENRVYNASGAPISAIYPYNAYNYSDQRVAKGDFIRLKNVSLSYLLPKSLATKMQLSSMQVSLVGNNIALLYSDKRLNGADPEFFNTGGVAMPIPKQYTLSVKVGL